MVWSHVRRLGYNGNAFLFAQDSHDNYAKSPEKRFRKYTGEPYWWHCANVAQELKNARIDDPDMIAAAWLHDVVEDTTRTIVDIRAEFGDRVAALVEAVTDVSVPSDGNRAVRKAIDRKHLAGASPEAKTIKLADLIDNTRSIAKHDPGFAAVYLGEKRALLRVLHKASSVQLLAKAWRILLEAETQSGEFAKAV